MRKKIYNSAGNLRELDILSFYREREELLERLFNSMRREKPPRKFNICSRRTVEGV
jgi:hypothetical protein